ncbi:MAG: rhamnogalacturonan acetylesterase [Bacteroidales bacterium]|nr:rhamnogalacturonan acetylesterase [Bacteroidales bacterium]
MKAVFKSLMVVALVLAGLSCSQQEPVKPTIYTIGDSTVKCGQGKGGGGLWGWGEPFQFFFDTTQVNLVNVARGGTSSRTYRTLGLWQPTLDSLKAGDFVFIQFGHNDAGALNDSTRARGTIRGVGDESEVIDNILTGEMETVYSYGAYLSMYVKEIREKGATPILIAPIPRNSWNEEGRVPYNDVTYGGWARQIADQDSVMFINLNQKMADAMTEMGQENVTDVIFWERDHTHTTAEGAVLSASLVVEGIRENPESPLNKYLLKAYPSQAIGRFVEAAKEVE